MSDTLKRVIAALQKEREDWGRASEFPIECPHGHGMFAGLTCPECSLDVLKRIGELRTEKGKGFCGSCGAEVWQLFNGECSKCQIIAMSQP
jgi:hypothetical protein